MRRELALFIGGPGARNLLGSVVWGEVRTFLDTAALRYKDHVGKRSVQL